MEKKNRNYEREIYEFLLKNGDSYISEIANNLGVSRITVKIYLSKLLGAGKVVPTKKIGKAIMYKAVKD
ncbi:MAG: helix-turn-helix domain-containing protein [Nanopusillaceae archaeon]